MKGVKHYRKDGRLYTGKTHKHNGRLMTGTKHTASSEYLTHTKPKGRKKKWKCMEHLWRKRKRKKVNLKVNKKEGA